MRNKRIRETIAVSLAGGMLLLALWPGAAAGTSLKEIRQNLFATCFASDTEGWVVGELGRVLHTTDAGRSFEAVDMKTRDPFTGVDCRPDGTVLIVGPDGRIVRSADAGKTWKKVDSGTDQTLLNVAFADENVVVAIGDFGTIIRSTDGGESWSKVPIPTEIPLPQWIAETITPGDVLLYDVQFITPERAWIVGEFGVIFASEDGGATWTARQSPVETTLFGVGFRDEQNGWAVGLESVMIRTTDGGATWKQAPVPNPQGFFLALYDVAVEGEYGWAIGDNGFILRSTDGGESWSQVNLPIEFAGSWLRGLSLLPTAQGFMVGSEGLVMRMSREELENLRQPS